jgi:pimeloyl-ACP methyl ester carboxylesterase
VLAHDRRGSGPPLVLLHGIGMRWQWWEPCLEALARRHDVIAVDLPGFGGTAPLAAGDEPTPTRQAVAVEALVAELGLERPHVAGISMGGQVSLELARRGSVASATAISPGGLSRGREIPWATVSLTATERMVRRLAPHADAVCRTAAGRTALMGQMCARGWRIPPASLAGHLRSTAFCDFNRTLRVLNAHLFDEPFAATVPVTVAWGTRDRLLLPRQADRAVALIAGSRKLMLRGAGHIPTYDDPQATVVAVLGTTGAA